jgi:alpha-methylacyl-CoA racemase
MQRPLEGIRVLDLTRLLPGPYATLLLADLGADVVRVEDTGDSDFVRWLPPAIPDPSGGPPVGALFLSLNRNKRSIVLDLKKPDGKAAFLRLADKADVVIEGFRPGVVDRLGIGWDVLSARNPRLTLCSMSGWGQDGPYAQRAGHDLGYIAIAGLLGVGGLKDGAPAIPGVPVADLASSFTAVSSILAALLGRERADSAAREARANAGGEPAAGAAGRGVRIDASMYDAAAALMLLHYSSVLAGGPMGRGDVALTGRDANYRVYETSDGKWLSVANLEPKFWKRFIEAVNRPDLANAAIESQIDPAVRAKLHVELEKLFATATRDEWMRRVDGADCCIEPVLEGAEVLDHPHAKARGAVATLDDPRLGKVQVLRTPLRPFSADAPLAPAPRTGEHGDAVLKEAGFDPAEIQRLRASGVLG